MQTELYLLKETLPWLRRLLHEIVVEYDETDDGATYEDMKDLRELVEKIESIDMLGFVCLKEGKR